MCDYSLIAIPNRLAVPGDDLVIHRFDAGVLGMVAASGVQAKRENHKKTNGLAEAQRIYQALVPKASVSAC